MLSKYYRDKKVLITGHTGFKGSWLCCILNNLGADVYGYALEPPTDPSLYRIAGVEEHITSEIGDVRDYEHLSSFVKDVRPDVLIHMAAQPLVRTGYDDPKGTYETNCMGTVNILECVRNTQSITSFLNVTTDKVYENLETKRAYKETDRLDGYDPYSNSKSCSELITHSYKRSFFGNGRCAISTARSGNVIGGGDFAKDRIIPDCIRAAVSEGRIILRNPNSVRPYQHVIEPLFAYLQIAMMQDADVTLSGNYNSGPDECDIITTGELADMFCRAWGGLSWERVSDGGPHEANLLMLDNSHIKKTLNVAPKWHINEAVDKTVEWTRAWISGMCVRDVMMAQIKEYHGDIA